MNFECDVSLLAEKTSLDTVTSCVYTIKFVVVCAVVQCVQEATGSGYDTATAEDVDRWPISGRILRGRGQRCGPEDCIQEHLLHLELLH